MWRIAVMEKLTSAFVFAFPAVSYRIRLDLPIEHHHEQSAAYLTHTNKDTHNDNFGRAIK
jgi:hypothetical protein